MQSEPVLRLIGVDGTFRCVHLFIDYYYRLSRKETRSFKRNYCLSVKQERASVHFDHAYYRCFMFLSSHIIPLPVNRPRGWRKRKEVGRGERSGRVGAGEGKNGEACGQRFIQAAVPRHPLCTRF